MVSWLPTNTFITHAFVYKDDVKLSEGHQFPQGLHNVDDNVSRMHDLQHAQLNLFSILIPLCGGGLHGKPIEQSLLNIPLCRLLPLPMVHGCRYLK